MNGDDAIAAGTQRRLNLALLAAAGVVLVAALVFAALPPPRVALAPLDEPAPREEQLPTVAPEPARPPPPLAVARPVEKAKVAEPYPWEPAKLVRALAPLQREVVVGLSGLDRASGCAWGDMFAKLTLATGDGEVRVEAIELWRRPPPPEADAPDHDPLAFAPIQITDEAAASCVRLALADRSFRAPSAKPGRRWQTSYTSTGDAPHVP